MISICPFTHRTPLYRNHCPHCQRETLWRASHCLTCGYTEVRIVIRKRAFGARLVLNRKPKPS